MFKNSPLLALLALSLSGISPAWADPLQAQFLGVSTVQVTDGETSLLTDGFFSRPSVLSLISLIKNHGERSPLITNHVV